MKKPNKKPNPAILLMVFCLCLFFTTGAHGALQFGLDFGQDGVLEETRALQQDEEIAVDIYVSQVPTPGLRAMGFTIVYDVERLQVIDDETTINGIWLLSPSFPDTYTPGEIHFTGFQTGAGLSGNQIHLGTMTFRCMEAGASDIRLMDRGPTDDFVLTDGTVLDEVMGDGFILSQIITSADLRVEKSGDPEPVRVGEALFYTVTVTNLGPSQALNVTLTDQVPAVLDEVRYSQNEGLTWTAWTGQLQLGTLDAGSFQRILLRGTLSSFHNGSLSNTATVQSDSLDPDGTNNEAVVETRSLPKQGDINGDDAIELKDAIMVLRLLIRLDTDTLYAGADATGDGRIGVDDASFILRSLSSE